METNIVYDSFVYSKSPNDKFGTMPYVAITQDDSSNIRNGIYYWDISHTNLVELKLKVVIEKTYLVLDKWEGGSNGEVKPNNIPVKLDLYKLSEPVNEKEVTWSTLPKLDLLKKEFVVFDNLNANLARKEITLNLTEYIEDIPYGIVLKINELELQKEVASKYPIYNPSNPRALYYKMRFAYIQLYSSRSSVQPLLTYNFGVKPKVAHIVEPSWGELIERENKEYIRVKWEVEKQEAFVFGYNNNEAGWVEIKGNTNKYADIPLKDIENGDIFCRVKIKAGGAWSDYSQTLFIQVGEKLPTPIVTVTNVNTSRPKISWQLIDEQYAYQVQILEGDSIILDTLSIRGKENYFIVDKNLDKDKTYIFKVRISNKNKIWSNIGEKKVLVNFTVPDKTNISLFTNSKQGEILIRFEEVIEKGTEKTLYYEILRSEDKETWEKVGETKEKKFLDKTPIMNSDIRYKVRTIGQNGFVDSKIEVIKLKSIYNFISDINNEYLIRAIYNESKNESIGYKGEVFKFLGRNSPVVEFDTMQDRQVNIDFILTTDEELEELKKLVRTRDIIVYRDKRKRKIYGSIVDGIRIDDESFDNYKVSFTIVEVDHKLEVI